VLEYGKYTAGNSAVRMSKKQDLLELTVWKDCESGQGGTFTVDNGMKVHIRDPATWMDWKEQPLKKVPHCILQHLRGNGGSDMELRYPEERYITGESAIVDDIDKTGARMLMTNKMQSEIAFGVTRTDVVAFVQTDYILQGQPHEHTQYCHDLPVNFMKKYGMPPI
jgi:hypothetical protein